MDKQFVTLEERKKQLESEIITATNQLNCTIDMDTAMKNTLDLLWKQKDKSNRELQERQTALDNDTKSFIDWKNKEEHRIQVYLDTNTEKINTSLVDIDSRNKQIAIYNQEINDRSIDMAKRESTIKTLEDKYNKIDMMVAENKDILQSISQETKKNKDILQSIISTNKQIQKNTKEQELVMDKNIVLNKQINENRSLLEDEYSLLNKEKIKFEEYRLVVGKIEEEAIELKNNGIAIVKDYTSRVGELEENEYKLSIKELDLEQEKKQIVKQSKLYNLSKD